MSKLGFDLSDFGGNVDLMLIKGTAQDLEKRPRVPALTDASYIDVYELGWCHLGEHGMSDWRTAAAETSKALSTRVIYFFYQDAVGWQGYTVFDSGDVVEDYSFGENFDEEMIESGVDPADMRPAGTIAFVDDDDQQYLFKSNLRTLDTTQIGGGDAFIDAFFKEQKTYLGWDLFKS